MATEVISKRFGQVVRRHRIALRFSQERLAELTGLHPTYIGMVERGVRNPTLNVAARIGEALGVPLPRLLDECVPRERGGRRRLVE